MIVLGDCIEKLKGMKSDVVDSLVTDPPAGISFMGKGWDGDKGGRRKWCAWMEGVMRECLRVMKPGAHGLVWALPRTSHWTATALEDAGFEIRDCVYHLFGSGFPKSLDVSKAIDKAAGVERKIVGTYQSPEGTSGRSDGSGSGFGIGSLNPITAPATDAAKQWAGWGTALKPAVECWWLVRKPCSEKTVAANVLKWGTGALNIDGGRIGMRDAQTHTAPDITGGAYNSDISKRERKTITTPAQGRFPSHLILDEEAGVMLDAQSGTLESGSRSAGVRTGLGFNGASGDGGPAIEANSGGASRFFYCAKVSASERNAGLEGMPDRELATSTGQTRPNAPARLGSNHDGRSIVKNVHPTVKPQKLMRYLVRLVTPPGGIILDCFMGSGSTGLAAKSEGFGFAGIEREAEYFEIAKARIG